MQHFQFISDKSFKIFKEGLMHPGLALVAELRGTLGDFQVPDPTSSNGAPTSGFGSTVAPSVTCTLRKRMNAHDMHMTDI